MIHFCYIKKINRYALSFSITLLISVYLGNNISIAQDRCSTHQNSTATLIENSSDQLDADLVQQKKELEETKAYLESSECNGFFESSECKSLRHYEKKQMQALASLKRKQVLLLQSAATTRSKKPIAEMEAQTCNNETETADNGKQPLPSDPHTVSPPKRVANGDYRTMCVRLCDGYYYPISFPANARDFERDSQSCQNSCPGATTALFKHRVDEESQGMVEVKSNTPYSEFENAFTYRQTSVLGCTCSISEKGERLVSHSKPRYRLWTIARDTSPAQRISPPQVKSVSTKQMRLPKISHLTNIRIVGPAFLPDPEDKIHLDQPLQADQAPEAVATK